jgi:anhydro-N-acetylmuramic acid kinase
MDAIDAVLTDISDDNINILNYQQFPIPPDLQTWLRNASSDMNIYESSKLDAKLGELFAHAVNDLLKTSDVPLNKISAIGCHGQTVLHLPETEYPRTLQLGDPNIIAARTGITTVSDFRRADMAAGGQGAPLAPLFHDWKFRVSEKNRIVLNLGGMANITVLPTNKDEVVTGCDTGPGNALMDLWIQHHLMVDYDENGEWALKGEVDNGLLQCFLKDDYFKATPPKSTGKDDFNIEWINKNITSYGQNLSPEDVQATLLELTVNTVSDAIEKYAPKTNEILVCGGGIYNTALFNKLKDQNKNRELNSTKSYGVHPDAVEAVTFAWLAYRRIENQIGNIPGVTGAKKPVILGGVYAAS